MATGTGQPKEPIGIDGQPFAESARGIAQVGEDRRCKAQWLPQDPVKQPRPAGHDPQHRQQAQPFPRLPLRLKFGLHAGEQARPVATGSHPAVEKQVGVAV